MAPAKKVSRQEIIDTAFTIVRKFGWSKLSVRNIARKLKTSTMPVYSQFKSITEIEQEVIEKAMALLGEYQAESYTKNQSLNYGIGYVLFAWEEPNLFAAINDRKHIAMRAESGDRQFNSQVAELAKNPKMKGLSKKKLREFQFMAWVFVHGIASIKDWADATQRNVDRKKLIKWAYNGSRMLTNGFIHNYKHDVTDKN